jgi:peroxiredoxin
MKRVKHNLLVLFIAAAFSSFAQQPAPGYSVYVFLSENCPLTQSYIEKLNSLYTSHKSDNIVFAGVFSNYFSTKKTIDDFKNKYTVTFPLIKDKEGKLRERFGATVTPEVFVVDKNAMLIYSGRIDDSFYDIGKKRNEVTTNDLENILQKIASGSGFSGLTKTQAIGSVISLKK